MFDSFIVQVEGVEVELQSKQFGCILGRYHVGDVVSGAPPAVAAFFDTIWLDDAFHRVYREEEVKRRFTAFLALANGVFLDYAVSEAEWTPTAILHRLAEMREKWGDSGRVVSRLVGALQDKQHRVKRLEGRIYQAQGVIREVSRIRQGEEARRFLGMIRKEVERVQNGEDPLDVIDSILAKEEDSDFGPKGQPSDPLEPYRL